MSNAGTHANVWLKFGRRALMAAMCDLPEAKVKMPSDERIKQCQTIIEHRHPSLANVFCVADGLKINFEAQAGLTEQSMFYKGWTHGHCVTNLFVFGPDGRLIMAVLSAPGSIHDSTLAEWGSVCEALEAIYLRTGGICCLDSAFAASNAECLIKSSQDLNIAKNEFELKQLQEATSLRQAAEWGMRAVQGAFPRLKDAMQCEENGERKVILLLVTMLYNLRLEWVGLNQIRNVYVPSWS